MRRLARVVVELFGLCALLACARSPESRGRRAAADLVLPSARVVESSPFVCADGVCTQRHVRLPDDGEWRCAELEGAVWCAGGEPAAGVVNGSRGHGYRCGPRRGAAGERVCVDPAPDYPDPGSAAFRCHFEGDFGVTRVCRREAVRVRPVPADGTPDCWLDRDCGAGVCDRGYCAGPAR